MPPAGLADMMDAISRVGFPIFVALILLLRVDQMHVENIKAIAALTKAVEDLSKIMLDRRFG